ncbi:hypothetical protein GOP47_0016729 [Adiantum capillus-veneris]|uniref:Cytochrome c-552/DMSO reductase-like haem-binding domain-containing protein n=1 Tax=Adiantum capillus-veneris TaxID=13818 RepID=A0A9D4UJ09_ADICA|nr:hypothetical protein GOP47_0016729 [Adiantum capillus-veneris]
MACLGLLLLVSIVTSACIACLAHNDDAPPPDCHRQSGLRLQAPFQPGLITLDGLSSDWASVSGQSFVPLQAIKPDPAQPYASGPLNIKVVHDGHDVYFLLTFPGPFEFTQGDKHKCPSIALMFGIGDDATYNNMGGCDQNPDACSSVSCEGHAVDLIHFSIGDAIPGRLYGANAYDNANSTGKDSIGSLNDMYGWNPHCRYFDGLLPNGSNIPNSGAQNDWQGAWSHSSMDLTYGLTSSDSPYSASGAQGVFTFEFVRPLRTSDRFQQDVQFTIGNTHRFMAAIWFPVNHVPWVNYQHYTASCDWIPLDVEPSRKLTQNNSLSVISGVTLLFSLGALVASATVCWWTRSRRLVPFQAIEMS